MKKFAVAYASLFENNLVIEVVDAENEKQAILNHSKVKSDDPVVQQETVDWINGMSDDMEDIKEEFFNGEILVDVLELEQ